MAGPQPGNGVCYSLSPMRNPRPGSVRGLPALLGAAVLCAFLGGGAGLRAATEPGVEHWIERFQASAASAEEVRLARTQLAKLASGVREDPATRDACFALAESWLHQRGAGPSTGALKEITTAISLFPTDPRTPDLLVELARLQIEAGDPYGAHLAYSQLLQDPERASPALLTRAAETAARAGDMAKALEWSMRVDPAELSTMNAFRLHVARLKAAEALARMDIALEAASALAESDLESLRLDPQALLAVARVHDAAEQTELALTEYERFVNIHTTSELRPQAFLSFGQLLARTGRNEHAKRVYEWAIADHPASEGADFARLELLEVDGGSASVSGIEAYLEAARLASHSSSIGMVLDRFLERYVAAGLPLEAYTALAGLARDSMNHPDAAATAGRKLAGALEPVLQLLASRDDHLSVAAVDALTQDLGLPIPVGQRQAVQTARQHLGLPRLRFGELAAAIPAAQTEMKSARWEAALVVLDAALAQDREPWAPDVADARRLMAECHWRLQNDRDALIQIDRALQSAFDLPTIRTLRVLRADILFGNDNPAACAEYREAEALGRTPWVQGQLRRCDAPARVDGSPG